MTVLLPSGWDAPPAGLPALAPAPPGLFVVAPPVGRFAVPPPPVRVPVVPPVVVWVPVVPPVVRPVVPAVVWFAVPPVEWFAVPPVPGLEFVDPVLGLLPPPPAGCCAGAGFDGAEGLDGALGLFFCAATPSGMTIIASSENATVAKYLEMRVGFTLSPWISKFSTTLLLRTVVMH